MEDLKGICRNTSGHREGDVKAGPGGDDLPHAITLLRLLKLSYDLEKWERANRNRVQLRCNG